MVITAQFGLICALTSRIARYFWEMRRNLGKCALIMRIAPTPHHSPKIDKMSLKKEGQSLFLQPVQHNCHDFLCQLVSGVFPGPELGYSELVDHADEAVCDDAHVDVLVEIARFYF